MKSRTSDAFRKFVRQCQEQVLEYEAGAASRDPGCLHKMRVGVRRLRSVFNTFKPALIAEEVHKLRGDLRWLQGVLGRQPTPYALGIDRDGKAWYSSEYMDVIGRLDPDTGKVVEYPFPHAENSLRDFFMDDKGRMWFGSPANDKVGYFYLAGQ
jgi:CHAD domain